MAQGNGFDVEPCHHVGHSLVGSLQKMQQHLRPHEWPPKNSSLRSNQCSLSSAAHKAKILGLSPKVNNDQECSNSSLHASAEALLLLNNTRVDFTPPCSAEPEKENERPLEIPITAPIPLSYSVRGVEALRSLLSVAEGKAYATPSLFCLGGDLIRSSLIDLDEIGEPTNSEGVQQSDWQRGRPIYHSGGNFGTLADQKQQEIWTDQAPVGIRSITPSTLMALTEPCLMAWCLDSGADSLPTNTGNVEYNPSFCVESGYVMETTTRNLWGY